MQLTWHILVIVAAIFIGAVLFQRGEQNANMTDAQKKEANMYRNLAYLLWGIAVAMIIYYYYIQNQTQRANMNGYPMLPGPAPSDWYHRRALTDRERRRHLGRPTNQREQLRWERQRRIDDAARPFEAAARSVRPPRPKGRGEIETYPGIGLRREIGQDRERPRPAGEVYVMRDGGEMATYL